MTDGLAAARRDWLNIESAVTEAERRWLAEAATAVEGRHGPGSVQVHIGVHTGASLACCRAGAPTARIVGIDTNEKWCETAERYGAEFVHGDSREVWTQFTSVHLLFVDGMHQYEPVRQELQVWPSRIAEAGVLAFHDYLLSVRHGVTLPQCSGVQRAVDEWERGRFFRIQAPDSIAAFVRLPEEWQW